MTHFIRKTWRNSLNKDVKIPVQTPVLRENPDAPCSRQPLPVDHLHVLGVQGLALGRGRLGRRLEVQLIVRQLQLAVDLERRENVVEFLVPWTSVVTLDFRRTILGVT